MFGSPENNNTELRSDSTSGDVSEVESGLEVTESEMDEELRHKTIKRLVRLWNNISHILWNSLRKHYKEEKK